ncbi:unnamed protein product [Sphagnum jensenii]
MPVTSCECSLMRLRSRILSSFGISTRKDYNRSKFGGVVAGTRHLRNLRTIVLVVRGAQWQPPNLLLLALLVELEQTVAAHSVEGVTVLMTDAAVDKRQLQEPLDLRAKGSIDYGVFVKLDRRND